MTFDVTSYVDLLSLVSALLWSTLAFMFMLVDQPNTLVSRLLVTSSVTIGVGIVAFLATRGLLRFALHPDSVILQR